MEKISPAIFNIKSSAEFEQLALQVFRHQAEQNQVYKKYLHLLGINPVSVYALAQIPFLPIEFFKTHQVVCGDGSVDITFTSSGTTGSTTSKHHVKDLRVYEESFCRGFNHFYGNVSDYVILALLPAYLEREGSSLIYMVQELIAQNQHPQSGFYLNNVDELLQALYALEDIGQKTLLIGVSFALLDLVEKHQLHLQHTTVMETGGMKGRRKELIREELHQLLCAGFGVNRIHSEYGMTELLSQAYSKGGGIFECPPWMKVLVRDPADPFCYLEYGQTGGINVIDLANYNSCSFISTQDLGKTLSGGTFEILGRFDTSDIRGCNLLIA